MTKTTLWLDIPRMPVSLFRRLLLTTALALLAGCQAPPATAPGTAPAASAASTAKPPAPLFAKGPVPLPRLSADRPVELRVAYVVNDRLPRMTAEQLQILLAAMQQAVREHFGAEVRFTRPRVIPIARVFGPMPQGWRDWARNATYDALGGTGDRARLERGFIDGFRKSEDTLQGMLAYAGRHAPELRPDSTVEELGRAMVRVELEGWERWRRMPALDGGPAIDNAVYSSFFYWGALARGGFPYELVLTNQLIATSSSTWPTPTSTPPA